MSSTTRAIAAAFNQMIAGRKLHAPGKMELYASLTQPPIITQDLDYIQGYLRSGHW